MKLCFRENFNLKESSNRKNSSIHQHLCSYFYNDIDRLSQKKIVLKEIIQIDSQIDNCNNAIILYYSMSYIYWNLKLTFLYERIDLIALGN